MERTFTSINQDRYQHYSQYLGLSVHWRGERLIYCDSYKTRGSTRLPRFFGPGPIRSWLCNKRKPTTAVNYITVFVKMKFFKIWGNIMFFCWFAFFFSRQRFSAVSWPICTKFGTNVSSCMRFILRRAIYEKLKNQVTKAKKLRNFGQFLTPAVTFSLVVTKRLNIFEPNNKIWHLGCYTFQKM